MSFQRKVIFRYLRARRGFLSLVTGFSVLGIMLGVAALIVVMSVMAGFREELLDRILGMGGHMVVTQNSLSLDEGQNLAGSLIKDPNITQADPYVSGQAMMVASGNSSGAVIRGVQQLPKVLSDNLVVGEVASFNKGEVIIGAGLANQLGVGVGSGITLLSPRGTQTIMGFIPRMRQAFVAGVFEVGMYQYDNAFVFMPIRDAQNFFGTGENISAIELKVTEPGDVQSLKSYVQNLVPPKAFVQTWVDSNRQFFQALQVEKVTMFIILALIVVVAAFNIITGQIMLVNDKAGDIAILRTYGATRGGVMKMFFGNGLMLGGIGTLGGLVLGLLIIWNLQSIVTFLEQVSGTQLFSGEVYFLDSLPARLVISDIAWVMAISLALTVIASLYPAWRATRVEPVEVLRNE